MAQPLRIEHKDRIFLITTRTIASRLWFVSNRLLEERVLAYLARYQEIYGVEIFAFIIMGNHYHLIARFPKCNKTAFMRAFNAIFAKLTAEFVPRFDGGRLWGRRYSEQVLAEPTDVTHWFYYCALNPVLSGVARKTSEYPGYNSFFDAAKQKTRKFMVFERMSYHEAIRRGQKVKRKDFLKSYILKFSKLPEFSNLSGSDYSKWLELDLLSRQKEALSARYGTLDFNFSNRRMVKPGELPAKTKKSHRYSFRPLVLSLSKEAKQAFLNLYFSLRDAFLEASSRYRAGDYSTEFPPGMYRPFLQSTS